MKFDTFRYLVREGFRSLKKNTFMAVASVLVLVACLLITGCAYLVYQNVEHGFDWAYQQNVVVAYAKEGTTDQQLAAMESDLKAIPNVAKVTAETKEQLLDRYKEEFGELYEDLAEDNPLPDAFVIQFRDLKQFGSSVAAVEKIDGIEQVDYDNELSASLIKIRDLVMTVGVWVIVLLLLVSLFIIANTIKLTVYSRQLEIQIMRSVGATRGFIRFPFMVEGVILGFLAGTLAYGLLYLLYHVVGKLFTFGSNFALISFGMVWWQVLLAFLVGGMLTGMIGSTISATRYLREKDV